MSWVTLDSSSHKSITPCSILNRVIVSASLVENWKVFSPLNVLYWYV